MATFRHKTIRAFRVANFQFKNHLLSIQDPNEVERFKRLVNGDPDRGIKGIQRLDQLNIVEIDEAALRALERPMGQTVIKGVDSTGKNLTPSTGGTARPVAKEQEEKLRIATENLAVEAGQLDLAKEAFEREKKEFEESKAKLLEEQKQLEDAQKKLAEAGGGSNLEDDPSKQKDDAGAAGGATANPTPPKIASKPAAPSVKS